MKVICKHNGYEVENCNCCVDDDGTVYVFNNKTGCYIYKERKEDQ